MQNVTGAAPPAFSPPTPIETAQMTYLLAAINDTQAIIRALDTKLGTVMAILIIPFTKFAAIFSTCKFVAITTSDWSATFCQLLITAFAGSWLLGFLAAFRGLIGIDNPTAHISVREQSNLPKGTFFCGGLFEELTLRHVVIKFCGKAKITLEDQTGLIPATIVEIHKELMFEQIKLAYIRHLKMHRMRYAFWSGFIWVFTGGLIWLISLVLKG